VKRFFSCPYHAWAYDLDGAVRTESVAGTSRFRLFDVVSGAAHLFDAVSADDATAWTAAINGSAAATTAADDLSAKAKLAVQRLEQLPLEPTVKTMTKLVAAATQAVFNDIAASVGAAQPELAALPLGLVAVEIGRAIVSRTAGAGRASDVGQLAASIAGCSDAVAAQFCAHTDAEGLKDAEELLGRTFYAFRLTIAATGADEDAMRCLGACTSSEALDKAAHELREALKTIMFLLGSSDEQHCSAGTDSMAHLEVLAALPAAKEAVKFWTDAGLGVEAPVEVVLALLHRAASVAGVLPAALVGESLANVTPIHTILATDCDLETTTPVQLAALIGRSSSIAACLAGHLSAVSPAPVPATVSKKSNLWVSTNKNALEPMADRR
ncbi:MAG: hypothetical protein ACOVN2_11955, partial [Usitatibacteraceae bacterium]